MKKDVFYYEIKCLGKNHQYTLTSICMTLKIPYIYNLLAGLSKSDLEYLKKLADDKEWDKLEEILSKYPVPHVSDALFVLTSYMKLSRKYQSWRSFIRRVGSIRIEHNRKYTPKVGRNLLKDPLKFFWGICKSRRKVCQGRGYLYLYISLYYWERWQKETTKE